VVGRQKADITDTLHIRDVAMSTTFWLSMGYNFGCQAIRWRHSQFRGSKGRCHGKHFWLSNFYTGCTLAPPGEYDWTVPVPQRCGLMSNYLDHLLTICGLLYVYHFGCHKITNWMMTIRLKTSNSRC